MIQRHGKTMKLELISIATDTHPLDGLFYQPESGASAGAVLFMHGNCSNFYTGVMRFLPPALVQLGYSCLVHNRRGHDVIATLNRGAIGGAYQRIDEAIDDNRSAARWLSERGFPAPVVAGHSNGGMLAVRHAADHPETPALVLMSAHRGGKDLLRLACQAGLFAGERYEEFAARARELVAQGNNELMVLPGWFFAISPRTFLDHMEELPDILALAPQIRCPTLYVRGDREPKDLYPAEEFADLAAGPCQAHVEPECDHFYGGREDSIRRLVGAWLQRTLTESGARHIKAKRS
jgi:pimeloyl-ACP methyl ester carboxylesterase